MPQIKDLKLIIKENCVFTACNKFFIAFGVPYNSLKINIKNSFVFSGLHKASLDTSLPPKLLSLYCKQINRVKKQVDGQPSSLLSCIQVSDYKVAFIAMYLEFLEPKNLLRWHKKP